MTKPNPFVFRKRVNIEVPITDITEAVEEVLEEKKLQKLVKNYFLSSKGIIIKELIFENTIYRDFLTHILLDKLCKPLMDYLINERKNSGFYIMITRILNETLLSKFVGISCIVQSVSGQDIQLNLKESLKNLITNISEKEVFREYDFLICACEIIIGRLYRLELENLRKPIKDLFSEDRNIRGKAKAFFQETLNIIRMVHFRKRTPEREFIQTISERIRFMLSLEECLNSDQKEFLIPLDYNFKITNFLEDGEINDLREIIAKFVPVADDDTNINDEFVKKTSLVNMRNPHAKEVFHENLTLEEKISKLAEYYKQQLVKYQKEGEGGGEEENIESSVSGNVIERDLKEVIERIVKNKLFKQGVSIKKKVFHPVEKLLSSSLKIIILSVVVLLLTGTVATILILELYNIRLINKDFIRDIAFFLSIVVILIFLVVILILHGSQRKFLINKLISLKEEGMIRRINEFVRKEIITELIQTGSVRETLKNAINLKIGNIFDKEEIKKEIIYDTIYLIEKDICKRSGFFQSSYRREVFNAYIDFKRNLQQVGEIKEENIKNVLDILLDSNLEPFDLHEEISTGKKIILENNIQRTKKNISVSDQTKVIEVYEKSDEITEQEVRDSIKKIENQGTNLFPIFICKQNRNIYILQNEPHGEIREFSVQQQGRYILYVRQLVKRKILRLISFLNFLNPISYFGFDITHNFIKPSLIRLKRILEGKEILLHDFSFMKLSALNDDHYTIVHNFMYKIMKEKLRFFLTRDVNYGFYIPKFFENAQMNKIYQMIYDVVKRDLQDLQTPVINEQSENKPFLISYILNTINNIPLGNEVGYSRYQLNKKFFDLQNVISKFICQQNQLNRYDNLTYRIEFRPFSINVGKKITLLIKNGNIIDKLLKFRKVSLAISVVSGVAILSLVIDYNIRARIKIPKYLYIIYYSLLVSVITILLITDSVFFVKFKEGTQLTIRGISGHKEIIDFMAQKIRRQYLKILNTYYFIYQELGIGLLQTTYVKQNRKKRFLLYTKKRFPVIVTRYLEPLFTIQWHVLLGDLNFEYDINETRKIYSTFKEIVFDYLRNYEFYKSVTLLDIQ
jgi:hypothetical protein